MKLPVKEKRPSKAAAFTNYLCRGEFTKLGKVGANFRFRKKRKQLEEELDLLTSYSSDTIYRLSYKTMHYDYISPAVERLLGYTAEEMKQINFRSLIHETKIITDGIKNIRSFDDLEKVRKHGDVSKWQADYLISKKNGDKIWVSDVSHPWFDENGTLVGSVGSLRDITDRIEAEIKSKQELERIANIDALTGMPTRQEFFSSLDKELIRIKRSMEEVSILLIDIDHFKKINDEYGRDVGDMVLIEVSKVIAASCRETDVTARISGEEFGVLLPETFAEGAFLLAERIRKNILNHNFSIGSDKKPISCSACVGVATSGPTDKKESSDLYKIADSRLYIAKNTGRNQVSIDEITQTH